MSGNVDPRACTLLPATLLVNPAALVRAYYSGRPDAALPAQRVNFGTSGHRGSAFDNAFNEAHILAIAQAICIDRNVRGIDGPLFFGIDTHALSAPARLPWNGFVAQLSLGDSLGESSALGGVYPKPASPKYRTMNWSAYNAALKQRGSLDVWFDPEMQWLSAPCGPLVAPLVFRTARSSCA